MYKINSYLLESNEIENDSQSQEYHIQTSNDIPSINELNIRNLNNCQYENNTIFNNNLSSSLLKNNINKYNEVEKLDKLTRSYTNDYLINKLKLKSSKKKKIYFKIIKNTISEVNKIEDNNDLLQKKCGRKKKEDKSFRVHDKFVDDNVRRKCKHLILDSIREFINQKINIIYDGNIGKNIFKKEILVLNNRQKVDSTINYNKDFLFKTIGEIFSDTISTRFTNYPPDHNKILIKSLKNEEDEDKRKYFNKLFNLTFLQCLKHFREEDVIEEIKGLKCLREIIQESDYEKEYIDLLIYYFTNFENIIYKKKARKSKKKKELESLKEDDYLSLSTQKNKS